MPIEQVANAIVTIMNCPEDAVVAETKLENLGIDSLKAINILFELEEEFDIEIPNERIADMVTVADIDRCVTELINEKS